MKALVIWLIVFTYSCSAPDFSVHGLEGCNGAYVYPPSECGETVRWQVTCSLPLGKPSNEPNCVAPGGGDVSKVWCCDALYAP